MKETNLKAYLLHEFLIIFLFIAIMLGCVLVPGTYVNALDIEANSCSASDIQAAIDKVIRGSGGTVSIPACQADNTWGPGNHIRVTTDITFRIKGSGMDSTVIGYQDSASPGKGGAGMFFRGTGLVEISDFTFRGHKTGSGIPIGILVYSPDTQKLRIHHLRLHQFENTALSICQNTKSPMVVDHCEFGDQHKGMYGIRVTGSNKQSDYVIPASFGLNNPNALFIEDNYFNDTYHPVAAFGASNIVFRHNKVRNVTSWIDGHGPCYGLGCGVGSIKPRSGTYIYEIYDNDIDTGGYPTCMGLRGGTGIITDNILKGCRIYGIRLRFQKCSIGADCSFKKGCPHSNSDTTKCYQSPYQYWIWNNDFYGANLIEQSDQGTGCIRENSEYYLRAPKPGDQVEAFTKYPYPHPFVSGNAVSIHLKSKPSQNLATKQGQK
jgi:hypothetical protein